MQAHFVYAVKVGTTPSSAITLDEGTSQVMQLRLDQPIIVQSGDPHVVISIVSDDPARVSVSSSPISFGVNEWFVVKTFTLSVIDNNTYDTPDSVVVHLTVASGSQYYDGFTNTVTVQINEDDPYVSPPSTNHTGSQRMLRSIWQIVYPAKESNKIDAPHQFFRLGMTDKNIKDIQVYLNTHGYPVSLSGAGSLGNETLYFGPRTKTAVMLFQEAQGIISDGIVGPLTMSAMVPLY